MEENIQIKMKIRKLNFIYIVICILFTPWQSYAMGKVVHKNDMIKVYSFLPQDSPRVQRFFDAIHAAIDYAVFDKVEFSGGTGNPPFVKKPPFERTVWANHRIWFHWGYNTDPQKYTPLTECINNNISRGLMLEEHRSLFYSLLKDEISRRDKILQDITANLLGYNISILSKSMKSQINAFITIPYAVHLLRDRTTVEVNIVLPMNDIASSVYTAIRNLAGNVEQNIKKGNTVIKKLKQAQNNPIQFLEAMQELIPDYIMSLEGGIYDIKSKVKKI